MAVPRAVSHADRLVGAVVERAMGAHHARRLRRLGHAHRLDPPDDGRLWAADDPPPREGCDLEVLIDGATALEHVEQAIRGARSHVHIAGWSLTPHFPLTRDEPPVILRELLAEAAERVDVRVLLWAGAPPHTFQPDRRAVRACRDELVRRTRIRVTLDARSRALHCHHEKLVIVDDEVAFVGGIDLTLLGGDRWDTSRHPARGRLGWHDAAARLRGPAVADVAAHFAARWSDVAGEPLAPPSEPAHAGDVTVQVVRTVPERQYRSAPAGDFRILESLVRALRSAQRFVYLESQFLWAPEVVRLLAAKLRNPPSEAFRAVVVLPSRANNGQEDTRGQLAVLADADRGAGRFLAATIAARTGRTVERVYVHAKVSIVDDRWLSIGSANLNAHSLFNDSEVDVITGDPRLARDTRVRLWAEHLERPVAEVEGRDPAVLVDELWRPIAREQLQRARRGEERTHRLIELPPASRRVDRLLGPLDALVVDG